MAVHDLTEALEDSAALVDVATRAGVSIANAKRVCAALAALSKEQLLRICVGAHKDRIRQSNREWRMGR